MKDFQIKDLDENTWVLKVILDGKKLDSVLVLYKMFSIFLILGLI